MPQPDPKQNPTFFWQGLLILLPVALLATLGFFFVRQDKLLAEHEAVQRAQEIADELLPKLGAELVETNRSAEDSPATFEVDAAGQLLNPPPAASTLVPLALDLSALNPDQERLWLAAVGEETAGREPDRAIKAYGEFLALNPPARFAALAQYSLGLLLAKTGDQEAARSCFQTVWKNFPDATGESGLPLKPLAGLKLLELQARSESTTNQAETGLVNEVCSNVVWNPTQLSAEILDRVAGQATTAPARAAAADWKRTWLDHEGARALFAAAAQQHSNELQRLGGGPEAFWFATPNPVPLRLHAGARRANQTRIVANEPSLGRDTAAIPEADENWLALRAGGDTNTSRFICRSRSEIGACLTSIVVNSKQIPEYFGVGLDVAGKRLTWPAPDLRMWEYQNYFGREGGGQKRVYSRELSTNVLASAALEGNAGLLKVNVYLTSRSALLAREQARAFWLAALVTAAALAAGIGFIKAYRAFHRQLRLSDMKSNFVSSVSHELRAPIASVRLMAESLERGKIHEPGKQREYFQFIVQECRRLSALVENVLDFSRIEQGRKLYEFEPTDLAALTRQTVRLLEPYAAEREVTLKLQMPELQAESGNLQLTADGKALQQALVNLIDNAIKYSPKGQTVTVGLDRRTGSLPVLASSESAPLERRNSNGSEPVILLWVEDQGEGIPTAEHEKIFERFYRRGSELRRETQGVGIGLSIVKHIIEAHRGRVEVRSAPGEGSRFTIELPQNGQTMEKSETRSPKSE